MISISTLDKKSVVNLALEDVSIHSTNFCFEKFVGFKGIMSDGLDRIVP